MLKNTELEHESKSKELSVLKKTGFEHESRSKELSVLKKDCFEHRDKLKSLWVLVRLKCDDKTAAGQGMWRRRRQIPNNFIIFVS